MLTLSYRRWRMAGQRLLLAGGDVAAAVVSLGRSAWARGWALVGGDWLARGGNNTSMRLGEHWGHAVPSPR